MKHEKFKAFSSKELADEFLQDTNIVPKSISMIDDDKVSVLVIGYEEGEKKHTYSIESIIIDDVLFHGFEKAATYIEEAAQELGGVICQDLVLTDGGDLMVVFLTATDPE